MREIPALVSSPGGVRGSGVNAMRELPDWLRWALVLPAAAGAWVGAQVSIMMVGNVFYAMGLWNLPSWFVKIATVVAAPYGFVWAGAQTAPRHSFIVVIFLTVVHAIFATAILVLAIGVERLTAPLWWIITGYAVGITVTIVACVQFRRKEGKRTAELASA